MSNSVLSNLPLVKAHPTSGHVITWFKNSKGEKFGKVRVDQRAPVINNGYSSFANRSAFITYGEKDALEMEPLLQEDKPYPIAGKVQVIEATEPFYDGQEPKTKGADGDVITHLGAPVFRDTNYVFDLNAQDILLKGDKAGVRVTATAEEAFTDSPE